jgi:endonuclease VIII
MPEGDTLWRTAAALRLRLVGQTVQEVRPAHLQRLQGADLIAVTSRGKHLLMDFSNELTLHSHMKMTGVWHIYANGERWRQPAHLARGVLRFEGDEAVVFDAPVVEIVASDGETVAHLGPDVLSDRLHIEEVLRRARLSKRETLGELLLDQEVCAGIGNIYKCESLWELRLDPWQLVSETEDRVLQAVYERARSLMRRSLTASQFRKNTVHSRAGHPCPRCHGFIQLRAQGKLQPRQTFYCSRCQQKESS